MAVFFCAIPVGSALGYIVGGLVDAHFGWRMAFFVAGVPGIILAALTLLLSDPPRGAQDAVAVPRPKGAARGQVGAFGSQLFFGVFADWRKGQGFEGRDQWDPAFYLPAVLLVAAAILWQFVYPRRGVGETQLPVNERVSIIQDETLKTAFQAKPAVGSSDQNQAIEQ